MALQEILQGGCGGGGGGAKDSAGARTPDPLDPGATDALPVKGPVDQGHNALDLVPAEPEILEVDELEAALVYRWRDAPDFSQQILLLTGSLGHVDQLA